MTMDELKSALERNPNDTRTFQTHLEPILKEGNRAVMAEFLEAVFAAVKDPEPLGNLMRAADFKAKNYPGEVATYLAFRIGKVFLDVVKNEDMAEMYFRRLPLSSEYTIDLHDFYVSYYLKKENWRKLEQLFQAEAEMEGVTPSEPESKRRAARLARERNNLERAMAYWQGLRKDLPEDPEVHAELVTLYKQTDKWHQVADLLKARADALPATAAEEKVALYLELIPIYRDKIKMEPKIAATWQAILALQPDNAQAFLALCDHFRETQRWPDLIKLLKARIGAVDAETAFAIHSEVASIMEEKFNNATEAIRSFESMLEIRPDDLAVVRKLKVLYEQRRDWPKFVAVAERELSFLSGAERHSSLRTLAKLALENVRDGAVGIGLWKQVREANPDDTEAFDALMLLYERGKDFGGVAELLEERIALVDATQQAALLERLAVIYSTRVQDAAKSAEAWKRLLGLDGENHRARTELKKLLVKAKDVERLDWFFERYGTQQDYARTMDTMAKEEEDVALRIRFLFKLAELYGQKEGQEDKARAALEEILAADAVNVEAATRLVPLYRHLAKWAELVRVQDLLLAERSDLSADQKLDLLLAKAEVHEQKLGQVEEAFFTYVSAYQVDWTRSDVHSEVERLAGLSGNWEAYIGVLEGTLEVFEDERDKVPYLLRIAEIWETKLTTVENAIAYHSRALEIDGQCVPAMASLERLYLAQAAFEQLRDVVKLRLGVESDAEERKRLLLVLGSVSLKDLSDAAGAVAAYTNLVDEFPQYGEAYDKLAEVLIAQSRNEDLLNLLERKLSALSPRGSTLSDLLTDIGMLYYGVHGDVATSVSRYIEALGVSHDNSRCVSLLEELIGNEEVQNRVAMALEGVYERRSDTLRLADALEIRVRWVEGSERVELLERLKALYVGMENNSAAFHTVDRLLRLVPGDVALKAELEGIAERLGEWVSVVLLYNDIMEQIADVKHRHDVMRSAAGIYHVRIGDRDAAKRLYRAVLEDRPDDTASLTALQGIALEEEDWSGLLGIYEVRKELEFDARARIVVMFDIANLKKDHLDDMAGAARTVEEVLDLDPANPDALVFLDSLYSVMESWENLLRILNRLVDLAGSPEEEVGLGLRIAELFEKQLNQPERMVERLERVLQLDPDNLFAVEILDRNIGGDIALRVLDLLEAFMRRARNFERLIELLSMRKSFVEDRDTQVDLQKEIGRIFEEELKKPADAFEMYRVALAMSPADEGTLARLLSLAEQLSSFDQLFLVLDEETAHMDECAQQVEMWRIMAAIARDRLREPRMAIDFYARVLGREPEDLGTVVALAALYRDGEQWEQLVPVIESNISLVHDTEEKKGLLLELGAIQYGNLGHPDKAIAAYEEILQIDPQDVTALSNLEGLYTETGRFEELEQVLYRRAQASLDEVEKRAMMLQRAEVLEKNLDRFDDAYGVLSELFTGDRNDMEVVVKMEALQEKREDWLSLLDILKHKLQLVPREGQVEVLLKIATVYSDKLSDVHQAVVTYQRVLDEFSGVTVALDALEQIILEREEKEEAYFLLKPQLVERGDHERLLLCMEAFKESLTHPDHKVELTLEMAHVAQDSIRDEMRAFQLAAQALGMAPGRLDIADFLEAIALRANLHEQLVEAYSQTAKGADREDEAAGILLRKADFLKNQIQDFPRAIREFEGLKEMRQDMQILASLDELYTVVEDWSKLSGLLREEMDAVHTVDEKLSYFYRLAEVLENRLDDAAGACGVLKEALLLASDNVDTLQMLRRLYDEKVADSEAAEMLNSYYSTHEMWQDVADVLERSFVRASERAPRLEIVQKLSQVYLDRIGNTVRGHHFTGETLVLDPEAEHVMQQLLKLMIETDLVAETIGFLDRARRATESTEAFRSLSMEAGRLLVQSGRTAEAETVFNEVIGKDAEFLDAWKALEQLYHAAGRSEDHEAVLQQLVRLVEYEDERIPLLLTLGRLRRDVLSNAKTAIEAFAAVVDLDDRNDEALNSLAALYELQEMYPSLTKVLSNLIDLAQDPMERVALLTRLAVLYEEKLSDPEQAIAQWCSVLDWTPSDAAVLANLQRLYASGEKWQDFVDMSERETRLADTSVGRKIDLWREIARVAGNQLADKTAAQQNWEYVAVELPLDREAMGELRQLYRANEDFMKLGRLLEGMASDETRTTAERVEYWVELGQLRMEQVLDLDGAIAAWKQVLALSPGNAGAYQALETLYLDTARFAECVDLLEEKLTLTQDATDRITLLNRMATIREESLNRWQEAAETRLRIIEINETDLEQYARVAALYEDHEEWLALTEILMRRLAVETDEKEVAATLTRVSQIYEERLNQDGPALEAVKKAQAIDPSSEDLLASGERIATRAGLWSDLKDVYVLAVPNIPEEQRVEAMLKCAALCRDRLSSYEEAIHWFEKVLGLAADEERALVPLVELYEVSEKWTQLAGTLEQLAQVTSDFKKQVEYYLALGDTHYRRLGDSQKAVAAYQQVLENDPTEEKAVQALQTLYSELGQWENLIGVLQTRSSLHPEEDAELKLISGELWEKQLGQPLKAAELYEELVGYDPSQSEGYARLERIYTENEKWDRLAETYERMLSSTADTAARLEILRKLALLNETVIENADSAADYYQQVLDLSPEDRDAIVSLEKLYESREKFDDLVLVLRRAVQLAETTGEKVAYLEKAARIYAERLEDGTSAIMSYREILELDPAHLDTLVKLEALYRQEGDFMEVLNVLDRRIKVERNVDEVVKFYLIKGDIYRMELMLPDKAREQYHLAAERNPNDEEAMEKLIALYTDQETWDKVVDLLMAHAKALTSEERRAEVFTRIGTYLKDKMENLDGAIEVFEAALERVPSMRAALAPLVDIYVARERWEKAVPLLEMLLATMEREGAALDALADAYRKMAVACANTGNRVEALQFYRKAFDRDPNDLATLEGLARLNLEQKNYDVSEAYFKNLVEKGEGVLGSDKLLSFYQSLGEIAMMQGKTDSAKEYLGRVIELKPNDTGCMEDLARLMETHGDWDGSIRYKRQQADLLPDPLEKWKVLISIGDIYREKLDDMPAAIRAYNEAMEVQPYSKSALVKLLEIHINAKSFSEAITVLQHLLQVEESPQKKAAYTFTIATIYRQELKELEMAVEYYEQTLDMNPDKLEAFRSVDEILTTLKNWEGLEKSYRKMLGRIKGKGFRQVEFMLFKGLGEIYRSRLLKPDLAAASFEGAVKLQPDDAKIHEILAQLYEHLGDKPKAIAEHRALVTLEPERVESYHKMAALFAQQGRRDEAWFAIAVLAMGRKYSEEEKTFYERMRGPGLPSTSRSLDATAWMKTLFSKAEEVAFGEIFQTLYQAIGGYIEGKDPKELGLKKKDELDLAQKTVFTSVFARVCRTLGIPAPKVYLNERAFGMRIEATLPPVIVVGKDLLSGKSEKELAFIIGKNLAYFHPMHVLAACFPAPVLKTMYLAAEKFVRPEVKVEGGETEQFQILFSHIQKRLSPAQANTLSAAVHALTEGGRVPSVSKWLAGVELTANHAGLLSCMDLEIGIGVLRQESLAFSKLPPKEKAKELVLYAVSEEFAEARRLLGAQLGA
jgi:tetratricopeptide (TPR) repeat protein